MLTMNLKEGLRSSRHPNSSTPLIISNRDRLVATLPGECGIIPTNDIASTEAGSIELENSNMAPVALESQCMTKTHGINETDELSKHRRLASKIVHVEELLGGSCG